MLSRQSVKSVLVSVFIIFSMMLVGCGGAAQPSSSSDNGPVNLTWFMWSASIDEVKAWKYGVPEPTNSWTYAQFLDAAKKMTKGNDHGFIANPTLDGVLPFVLSSGGQYLTSDGKLNINNPQFAAAYQE